jgi:hypothetical protein
MDKQTAVDATVDVVENVVDAVETVETIVKNNPKVIVGVAVVSVAVGAGATYFIARKGFETKYAKLAEEEIEQAKLYYKEKSKNGDWADQSTLEAQYKAATEDEDAPSAEEAMLNDEDDESLRAAVDHLQRKHGYTNYGNVDVQQAPDEVVDVKVSISKNVFESHEPTDEDDYDLDLELTKKAGREPWIIEQERFLENEDGYSQITLTYYQGDMVLAETPSDKVVDNFVRIIGRDNLYFGRGSKDPNIVYIRNDTMGTDFEVVRSNGTYAEEVLGVVESDEARSRRRFRDGE